MKHTYKQTLIQEPLLSKKKKKKQIKLKFGGRAVPSQAPNFLVSGSGAGKGFLQGLIF
jgi:hypothetical protein